MKKSLVALLLALAMILSCFAYADEITPRTLLTNFDGTSMELPITTEPVSFTVMQGIRDTDATTMGPDLWYVKKCEADTGVHIDYIQVNTSDWSTQTNLMFASGDYADIIIRSSGAIDTEMYGVDQGIIIPVDDLLQYMPVLKTRMDVDPSYYASIIKSDGHMYAFPKASDDGTRIDNSWFINKTWLDNLGLEMPDSPEKLLDALRAFIKEDANGNGDPNDEIGYEATFDEMQNSIPHMWGIGERNEHYQIDDDGKVFFTPFHEHYREAVEFMATMYAEGLMDPANITQDGNSKIAVYNQNNIGMATCWRLRSMGWDVLLEDMAWIPPISAEGCHFQCSTGIGAASEDGYLTIAIPEDQREIAAKWIDYLMCDQCMYETYYGPEGKIWSWNADHKCEIGPAGDQGVMEYSLGVNGLYYLPPFYYNETFVQPDYRVERIEYNQYYAENGYHEKNPSNILSNAVSLTPDLAAEKTQIFANLETIYDQAVADMIMHGVTDEAWDSMINSLKAAGADRYVEIYQNAYDEYLAK